MNTAELVIIGDVIKSRKKFDPKKWEYFHQLIKNINHRFNTSIKIPLTIYSGDSFGGTCNNINAAIDIVLALQEYQKYHKTRIILIEDEISYGLEQNSFLTLEGPALWKSQVLLDELKKRHSFFLADLQNEIKTITINTILNLILKIRDDWSDLEWEVYRNEGLDITQKDLAKKLGVTQQYISKIIKKSKLRSVKESEINLKIILDGIINKLDRK